MIRITLILLGFVLGLAIAVGAKGTIGQARLLVGDALPGWTEKLHPESGLTQGQANHQSLPGFQATDTIWRLRSVDLTGATYAVKIVGDGVSLTGSVTQPWGGGPAAFDLTSGEIAIATALPSARISGQALVDSLILQQILWTADVRTVEGVLALAGLEFDGRSLGPGQLRISEGEAGTWLGQISLAGEGPLTLQADLRGQFDASRVQVDGMITPGTVALPDHWLRQLDETFPRSEEGWKINQIIDLADLK